ncbi:ATP-binding protein [Paenibacillus sp. HGH0039]|nr:ATP-binding protein [Paenibacillus sp. HGH0039]EPD88905.1 hypothetical protein HMPREF1207_01856 [Paenibacillus sp. HGH0039]
MRHWVVPTLLSIVFLLAFGIGSSIWTDKTGQMNGIHRLEQWQYYWGDFPRPPDRLYALQPPSMPDELVWRSVGGDRTFEERRNAPNIYWLRAVWPQENWRDPALYLLLYGNYEVYADRQLVYKHGEISLTGEPSYAATPRRLISMPSDMAGKTVLIRVQSLKDRNGPRGIIWAGEKSDITVALLKKDAFRLTLGFTYTCTSLISAFLPLRSKKYAILLPFSWFTAAMGIYLTSRTDVKSFFWDAPLAWTYIELFSLFLGVTGFVYFIRKLLGVGRHKLVQRMWQSSLLYTLCASVVLWRGWATPVPLLTIFLYFIIAAGTFLLFWVGIQSIRQRKEASRIFFGSVLFIGCGIFDSLSFSVWKSSPFTLLPAGLLLFLIILIDVLRLKMAGTLRAYAEELERKNQELNELDRLKDRFLANTSHELRTPLHGIIGIAQSLLVQTQSPHRQSLELIISNAGRLNHLIHDILDLRSSKDSQLSLQKQWFNLKTTIDGVCRMYQSLAKPSVRLLNEVPDLYIFADESRVHQIVGNLVGNAVKHTDLGFIRIGTSHREEKAFITVEDTGTGIPAEHLEHIFEEFFQLKTAANRGWKGSGLGLPIARRLAELHDGDIVAHSVAGQGSTFLCTLVTPKFETEDLPEAPHVPGNAEAACALADAIQPSTQATILIVDDEETSQHVIKGLLGPIHAWRLHFASSGEEALDLLHTLVPDLIVADVMLPGMDGFELCRTIRESPPVEDLKIIILTAKGREEAYKGYEAGANEYLPKPIEPYELILRIQAHLHARFFLRKEKQKELTERQVQFLSLAWEQPEISKEVLANQLFVKYETLKKDVKKINQYFESPSYVEAAVMAKRRNII